MQKHLQMFNDEIISRQLPIEKTRKATMCKISGSETHSEREDKYWEIKI